MSCSPLGSIADAPHTGGCRFRWVIFRACSTWQREREAVVIVRTRHRNDGIGIPHSTAPTIEDERTRAHTFDQSRRCSIVRLNLVAPMHRSVRCERKIIRDDDREKGISSDDDRPVGDDHGRRTPPSDRKILRIDRPIEKYFSRHSPAVGSPETARAGAVASLAIDLSTQKRNSRRCATLRIEKPGEPLRSWVSGLSWKICELNVWTSIRL